MNTDKVQLEEKLAQLESDYRLAISARKQGVKLLAFLGFIALGVASEMRGIGAVVIVITVMGTVLAFYAFVYNRPAELQADISATKIQLKMKTYATSTFR
ncbi:MAG: hypothetical protein U1F76_02590 [Candidatus Competibacteraceae bacterium]